MKNPTASIIIIGNEILSGRTLDTNTQEIAIELGKIGVDLIETRTIADDKKMIVETIRELNQKYDYIFTTGGIGPTHDDITAESIAEAFNLSYKRNDEVYEIIKESYKKLGKEMNKGREKMSYMPESSRLLVNDVTAVPGFTVNNLFAFAGIPKIMKSMLKSAIPFLNKGKIVKSKSVELMIAESTIAQKFYDLQKKYPNVEMGSYPFTKNNQHGTCLVMKSSDYDNLEKSFSELQIIIDEIL